MPTAVSAEKLRLLRPSLMLDWLLQILSAGIEDDVGHRPIGREETLPDIQDRLVATRKQSQIRVAMVDLKNCGGAG